MFNASLNTGLSVLLLLLSCDLLNFVVIWWTNNLVEIGTLSLFIMKYILVLSILGFMHCKGWTVIKIEEKPVNFRPIIGVLAQEQSHVTSRMFPENQNNSYIPASYVKAVESSGARVVPIMIGRERGYYEELMKKLNGVLLPGGAAYLNHSNGYADAGQHMYEIAQELNDAGDYFPIFGICLGFELLIEIALGRGKPGNRMACHSFSNAALDFTDDFQISKMFKDISQDLVHVLTNQDITINEHKFCIVDETIKNHNLNRDWRVTSHSKDENGLKFVATIEHKRYPFYGVQFHPEKSMFEWKPTKPYVHNENAIKASRYFIDFFVNECRKNNYKFQNVNEENQYLIYNYIPSFTGAKGSIYDQCYWFEPKDGVVTNENNVNSELIK